MNWILAQKLQMIYKAIATCGFIIFAKVEFAHFQVVFRIEPSLGDMPEKESVNQSLKRHYTSVFQYICTIIITTLKGGPCVIG